MDEFTVPAESIVSCIPIILNLYIAEDKPKGGEEGYATGVFLCGRYEQE